MSNIKNLKKLLVAVTLINQLFIGISASEFYDIRVDKIVDQLNHPWGIQFLPNKDILITERSGQLRLVRDSVLFSNPISGLPNIKQHGQGGLMDIAVHPDFMDNQYVYLSYVGKNDDGYSTEVLRGRLHNNTLEDVEVIFKAIPKSGGSRHFGGRLLFDKSDLYITLGDRGDRPSAQQLNNHAGSLIRIKDDGDIPIDNPYVDVNQALPEIYSYGHRNIQGIAIHPETHSVWVHEHGPQGGDELNIIEPAANYGWPVITYGVNYGFGTKIGEGTHKIGMKQPIHYWVPSIAPSGMAFYSGDEFPQWQNNLLVGSLKFGLLIRLEIENGHVIHEERMLDGKYGRIRDVRIGPDGAIYLLTDEDNGALLRISNPATYVN